MHSNRPLCLRWMLPVTCVLLLPVATRCQAESRRMQPADVANLQFVTSAAISPTGDFVAYTKAVPRKLLDKKDGPAYTELHVVDREGHSRPFVTGEVNVGSLAWMEDGKKIAYVAKRSDAEHAAMYAIPIDGGESQKLLEHGTSLSSPAVHPDGTRVAFLATAEKPSDAKVVAEQGFDQEIYEEDWRPSEVWIAELSSGQSVKLDIPGSVSLVKWHPTREELVIVSAPTSLVDDSYMFKRVSVVDAVDGHLIETIHNPGKLGDVDFSPDGTHLAMISAADIHDPSDGRLMVADVPGDGTLRDLLPDFEAHITSFRWLDDQTLAWIAAAGTRTVAGTVTLAGERQDWLGPEGPIVHDLTLARDGVACMVGDTPDHPGEVFVLAEGESKRLTHTNPWLAEIALAEQETVQWTARDGLSLEGILIKPLRYQEGRRYPLIMLVHGGPESHVSDGWITSYSQPGQLAATRGFAVFYPNYRGSTGRGVDFSKLGQADAAGKEFDDLIDGIDHLVELGMVDKDKVGITGGSYGGYASAWGATFYSDRFAASVMFVGISDNISKVGTTDIPEEMYLVHHRKRLWDDWDYFAAASPIRHVEKNHTPTLILHGKQDPRVHPSQSLELYRHLKTLRQAPVRLVLYEGEGHGNRKAAARFDYNLRMLRWMEHFLLGPGGEAPPRELDYEQALAD